MAACRLDKPVQNSTPSQRHHVGIRHTDQHLSKQHERPQHKRRVCPRQTLPFLCCGGRRRRRQTRQGGGHRRGRSPARLLSRDCRRRRRRRSGSSSRSSSGGNTGRGPLKENQKRVSCGGVFQSVPYDGGSTRAATLTAAPAALAVPARHGHPVFARAPHQLDKNLEPRLAQRHGDRVLRRCAVPRRARPSRGTARASPSARGSPAANAPAPDVDGGRGGSERGRESLRRRGVGHEALAQSLQEHTHLLERQGSRRFCRQGTGEVAQRV